MEDQVNRLVEKAWGRLLSTPPEQRLMIAIGGIPGSGKTTLSQLLVTSLVARAGKPIAAFVPMDGFHLTRAQLSAMPDPVTAHARRGAEFTFDGAAFLRLVQRLREPLTPTSGPVYAPSFDHAVKDPRPDDIAVLPSHRVVVFEGLYVALDREPWSGAAALMDELWFVEVDFEVARRRLARRHVAAGISPNADAADQRAVENDLPNGREIMAARLPVHEVIVSREDGSWVHE